LDEKAVATRRLNLVYGRLAAFNVQIDYDYLRTFTGKEMCRRPANAGTGAGD
jgi:hypothetical protein